MAVRGEHVLLIPPAEWCQIFFLLATLGVFAVQITPKSARQKLQNYGARMSRRTVQENQPGGDNWFDRVVREATAIGQVPHSWFIHFYILSTSCSLYWAVELLGRGPLVTSVARWQASQDGPSMSLAQVIVVWTMMEFQGLRRLYECIAVMPPSSSQMWVVHWLLAMCFYSVMSIAVWIEGSGSILHSSRRLGASSFLTPRIFSALALFLKYMLPEKGMFQYLICPHYTCECLIYLAMAFAAAPNGWVFNRTLLWALIFVLVNLGATATGTKEWYGKRFGPQKVAGRWKMIPLIF